MIYSKIAGTGSYLPEKMLTNFDLEKLVDTTDEWIRSRTGIERRHIAAPEQTACDLAEHAVRYAMEAAEVAAKDVDLIVLGTTTPDLVFPNTGCLLQERLGIHGPPAIQLEAACSGFMYALSVAEKFIQTGTSKCAVVVGVDVLSRIVDWTDRATCVLFADGAGAVVLTAAEEPGILSTHIHSDGAYAKLLYVPTGVSKREDATVPAGCQRTVNMKGSEIFKLAVNTLGRMVEETLAMNGLAKPAVDWLVPHQANMRIIQALAKKLELPMEKVIVTIQDHGNTSSASVPLALDVGVRDGRIKRGSLLLLEAFGGGLTWGSALIRY